MGQKDFYFYGIHEWVLSVESDVCWGLNEQPAIAYSTCSDKTMRNMSYTACKCSQGVAYGSQLVVGFCVRW